MPNDYQRKRLPYGFVFWDVRETRQLKERNLSAERILEKNHYQPVMPATVDFQDTFEVFGREDIFNLKDHLGDRLALRNDVTVQIIKGFCNQLERDDIGSEVSRYYYNVPVFTDVRKNYPSLREVQQLGAEVIGAASEDAIFEVILIADQILKNVFDIPYRLVLSDIRLFHYLEKSFPESDFRSIVFRKDSDHLIQRMLAQGWDEESASLLSRNLLYCKGEKKLNEAVDSIQNKLSKTSTNDTNEKKVFIGKIKELLSGLTRFKNKLTSKGIPIDMEPLLLRKPKYYTGLLFEGYISDLSFPPLRGGSYDELISEYSNQNYPASGFALDMSSILR